MKKRPVLQYPNTNLRKVAEQVRAFGHDELDNLIEEMVTVMRERNGIGLAATQIDVHKQIAVIELQDGPFVMINPAITKRSKKLESAEEGCLSVHGVFGLVERTFQLTLEAYAVNGKKFKTKAKGLFARVIQHECDHLNGKLFIDRCHQLTSGLDRAKQLNITIPQQ